MKNAKQLEKQYLSIPLNDLIPDPNQPRKTFKADTLAEMSAGLKKTGQIVPIIVRPAEEGKYLIVVGERRFRAARAINMHDIQCIVRHNIDDQAAKDMQFAENYQREDLSPLEQAQAYKAYIDEYGVSQRELSRRTGIPQRTISDRIALLRLPVSVRAQLEAGEIGPHDALRKSQQMERHEIPQRTVIKKRNNSMAEDNFEVELEVYDLISYMARWIELLTAETGFPSGEKQVICDYCESQGEDNYIMEPNNEEGLFECPRCKEKLFYPPTISLYSQIIGVMERLKRGYTIPEEP